MASIFVCNNCLTAFRGVGLMTDDMPERCPFCTVSDKMLGPYDDEV